MLLQASTETMVLSRAQPLLGSHRGLSLGGSLLLLLLSLGWLLPRRAQTAETRQESGFLRAVLASTRDFASLPPGLFLGLTCREVSGLKTEHVQELARAVGQKNITLQVDQLRCLAHHLPKHLTPADLDAFPPDLLLFLSPAAFPGTQACTHFFSLVSKANVDMLPQKVLERQRLLAAALACRGVRGSRVSKEDVQALGSLACDLPGSFVAESAEALLPWLAGCQGPLDQYQQEAAREALRGGGPPYGPPSRWTVSTLDALQGLLVVLDQPIVHSIPKGVIAAWLQRISRNPSWLGPELTAMLPRFRRDVEKSACPPGQKAHKVDEELVYYEIWELEACVDGAMLANHMDLVNVLPFTYEQLSIFKRILDKTYPQGYPETLIRNLGSFSSYINPEDIDKWNVTSPETVKALLTAIKGQKRDAQMASLMTRYLLGGGQLDQDILAMLADVPATYLCDLSLERLRSMPLHVMWLVGPQDLNNCSQKSLDVLYPKAQVAFQNVSMQEYFGRIRPFLGGASTEDLRALSQQNFSMDLATFKKLQVDALARLTVPEVQKLLGPHMADLKAEEEKSPVKDWLLRQRQEDLDRLELGLHGGIPNGYLVLDLNFREAFSRGAPLLAPEPALAWVLALLLALTLSGAHHC
uniref:mesothelin n=1 Tax=Jaculus jaculus TaxID=51337 RepID=UPI001E1B12A4|nr:mesothelin [Jaculus jaculus]